MLQRDVIMLNKFAAFSLIELMVVIGIVALLSAIAVPSYKSYKIQSNVVAMMPTLEKFKQQMTEYYNENGSWPDAADLGISTNNSVANTTVLSPGNYNPNFLQINISKSWTAATCPGGVTGAISAAISGTGVGGTFTTNTWYGGNNLAVHIILYTTDSRTKVASICGGRGVATADLKYLPAGCQQDVTSYTPTCS